MSDVLDDLRSASEGLLYPSESDAPFELVRFGALDDIITNRPFKEQTLDQFFAELLTSDDADRYRALRQTLESRLTNLKVLRIGSIQVEVYIVGQTTTGAWAGLRTTSIET